MFSCCSSRAVPSSPAPPTQVMSSGIKRKHEPASDLAKKARFQPSPRSRVRCYRALVAVLADCFCAQRTLPPTLQRKVEGWLREALHIIHLAQCTSTDPSVKSGLFAYASELFVSSIKLDATRGSEVARVLVDISRKIAPAKLRSHAEGVIKLSTGGQLPAEMRAAMEKVC